MLVMKRIFTTLVSLATLVGFVSCQKTEQTLSQNTEGSRFTLSADILQTKTTVNGLEVNWEEGDILYLVTTNGTWGKPYKEDNAGATIAEYTYSAGTFASEATITNGNYTFNALYGSATQKSYHRGASTTYNLQSIQSQDCSNPTGHLKLNDALVGTFNATVPMKDPASVSMSHIFAIMRVDVKNATGADVELKSFEMSAAGATLAGVFTVNFTNTPIDITEKSNQSSSIKVNLTNGVVASGESLPVYFVMAPLAGYSGDVTFTVTDVNEVKYTKTVALSNISFEAGSLNSTPYTISVGVAPSIAEYPYIETFAKSQGDFTIDDGTLPSGLTYVWAYGNAYMKASAYVNGTNYATESWLVSPVIDMSAAESPVLSFANVARYGSNENLTLWAREKDGEWSQLSDLNYGSGKDWTFVTNSVDVSSYAGKTLQFAFKYVSTSSGASTWEIKDVEVNEAKTLKSIAWTGYTESYTVGDTFTADGIVTATYLDGTTVDVTSKASFSSPDMSTAGAKTVTITYEGKTTTGEITVKAAGEATNVDKTATITFGTNNVKISAASVTANDDCNNSWTITTVGTTSFTAQPTYYQVGSGSKPATSITFTTTLPSDAEVGSIEAKFGGFNGTAGTVSLKIGDTSVGSGSLNATADVTVSSTTTAAGNVVTVSITSISKGVKCYYIKVGYKTSE